MTHLRVIILYALWLAVIVVSLLILVQRHQ